MLANYFGDDEHTAADGPYNRVMKARKWLYLTVGVAGLYNFNLIKFPALEKSIGFLLLPPSMVHRALIFTLIYLTISYIAFAIQVGTTYDLIISDRIRYRKDDEVRSAQGRVDDSKREVIRLDKLKAEGRMAIRSKLTSDYSEQEHEAATLVYNRNVNELREIIESDPSGRPMYKQVEYFVDWSRIVVPLALSLVSIFLLIF